MELTKEREETVLRWFDEQPKNEDGSVTIKHDGTQEFPIEILGIDRKQLKSVPATRIGGRVSKILLDRLKAKYEKNTDRRP